VKRWVVTIVVALAATAAAEPQGDDPPSAVLLGHERTIGSVGTLSLAGFARLVSAEDWWNDTGGAEAAEPERQLNLELGASTELTSRLALDANVTLAPGSELTAIAQLSYAW
jgi:hypothetical protein